MKALILAAGRGERMRPLTDHTPKPLLEVHGKPLIVWHLESLRRAGIHEVVINTAWLEERIVAALGDGSAHGVAIRYSMEGRDHGGALETAGGLKKALPLLTGGADEPFWYVAGDIYAPSFDFATAAAHDFTASRELARLWLVPNPPQHPGGDFGIEGGLATHGLPGTRRTWSAIGLFRGAFLHELMAGNPVGTPAKLKPCLDAAIAQGRLGAVACDTPWTDVGTPQRLAAVNAAAAPA